jgi:type IV secretory pathway TraG/TraD family ATPase VirD4
MFHDLIRGTSGLLIAYGTVTASGYVGIARAEAPQLRSILFWPLASVLVLIASTIAFIILVWLLETLTHSTLGESASFVFGLLFSTGTGFWCGRNWGSGRRSGVHHARGTVVLAAARHPLGARRGKAAPGEVTVAGIPVPAEDELKHIKLIGSTGTGKSTLIREILHLALTRGDRAIIADPDGGYLSRFYHPARGDVILNPFDARSVRWDVFAELKSSYDAAQLARSLIPERGADPQWPGFARTFFEAVIVQAQAAGVRDLDELYRLLTSAPQAELRQLIAGTAAAPFAEEANLKMFMGQRATAAEHIKCFDYIRSQRGPSFSVKEWVRSGRGVLFLPYQADQIAAIRSVIATWMRLAIFQTMSLGEGDHRLWFAIDELDALGCIDGLSDALVRLRRFGGRCLMGLQSIGLISSTFGQGPAEAMVENCGTTVVLRCSASERGGTSRFASQLIGERQVVRMSQSRHAPDLIGGGNGHFSHGESEQHATEPAVMPSQIEQLPDRSGFLKFASHPSWMHVQFPFYELPKVAEPYVPYG